jgi:hypothetical protein|tara:strand:- start:73 stop:276 length:204 start_codon:yes stop_codon:yes gene_type:complete
MERKHRVVVEVTLLPIKGRNVEETEKEAALRLKAALGASMETLYYYGIDNTKCKTFNRVARQYDNIK